MRPLVSTVILYGAVRKVGRQVSQSEEIVLMRRTSGYGSRMVLSVL